MKERKPKLGKKNNMKERKTIRDKEKQNERKKNEMKERKTR